MKLAGKILGVAAGLAMFGASAHADRLTFSENYNDGRGKNFYSREGSEKCFDGASYIYSVKMEVKGERNSVVYWNVDGVKVTSDRALKTWRRTESWNINRAGSCIEFKFGTIDPKVYNIEVVYEGKVEVRTETVEVIKEVEVSRRNMLGLAEAILDDLEAIDNYDDSVHADWFEDGMYIMEDLVIAGDTSHDSDSSIDTTFLGLDFLEHMGNCKASKRKFRKMVREGVMLRQEARDIRTKIAQLHELMNHFPRAGGRKLVCENIR